MNFGRLFSFVAFALNLNLLDTFRLLKPERIEGNIAERLTKTTVFRFTSAVARWSAVCRGIFL